MIRIARKREEGMSVVLVVFSLVLLLGFAAIAIETGYLYTVRAQVQGLADAASLAAVRALQSCNADGSDRNAAVAAAQASAEVNKVDGIALEIAEDDITFGRYYPYGDGDEIEFVETNTNPNSVMVNVHRDSVRNGPVELVLARLIGIDTVDVSASAIASRDRRVVGFDSGDDEGKLIPFAGRRTSIGGIGSSVRFFSGASASAPGNWGLIDIDTDGSGFGTGLNNSEPEIEEQIQDGYEGTATIDPDGGTNTGGRPGQLAGSIKTALQGRIGDVVNIAVYDTVTGSGTNTVYHLTGFVAVRIDSVVTTGAISGRGVWATVVEATDAQAVTDPDADENCTISKMVIAK